MYDRCVNLLNYKPFLIHCSLIHSSTQGSLDPEETLDFQAVQEVVLTEAGVKMVFQEFPEPRVSLEKYWELYLGLQDGMVLQDTLEIRASLGHQEYLEHLVGLRQRRSNGQLLKSISSNLDFLI